MQKFNQKMGVSQQPFILLHSLEDCFQLFEGTLSPRNKKLVPFNAKALPPLTTIKDMEEECDTTEGKSCFARRC